MRNSKGGREFIQQPLFDNFSKIVVLIQSLKHPIYLAASFDTEYAGIP